MATAAIEPRARPEAAVRAGVRSFLLPLIAPGLLLALWFWVSAMHLAPSLLVPSPQAAFGRLYGLVTTGDILPDIGASLWRWAAGYVLGCALGMPIGLLIGSSPVVYRSTFPLLDFLRSLPVTALFPLFLLLFGIGDSSKIAMAFAATVFVVILNSAYGVLQAKQSFVALL